MIKLCFPPLFLHIFYTYGPLNFDLDLVDSFV